MSLDMVRAAWLAASLCTLCLAYGAFHRLYLTSLAQFPGPTIAALTGWYEVWYDLVGSGQFPIKVAELHQRYG